MIRESDFLEDRECPDCGWVLKKIPIADCYWCDICRHRVSRTELVLIGLHEQGGSIPLKLGEAYEVPDRIPDWMLEE